MDNSRLIEPLREYTTLCNYRHSTYFVLIINRCVYSLTLLVFFPDPDKRTYALTEMLASCSDLLRVTARLDCYKY